MIQESCRCNCGYTCRGPGVCELSKKDTLKCIEQHYVRDCDHKWDGPDKDFENGSSVTCSKCGMTALSHDMLCGP